MFPDGYGSQIDHCCPVGLEVLLAAPDSATHGAASLTQEGACPARLVRLCLAGIFDEGVPVVVFGAVLLLLVSGLGRNDVAEFLRGK